MRREDIIIMSIWVGAMKHLATAALPPPLRAPHAFGRRRALAVVGPALLLGPLFPPPSSASASASSPQPPSQLSLSLCRDPPISPHRAFLDVSIDGHPAGRILIGLYADTAPLGSSRFAALISGAAGLSYRRKAFIKIMPSYIQHSGLRSYGVDADLLAEWDQAAKQCPGTRNLSGSVGLVVRNPNKPPPKPKLVARQGRLQIDQEDLGPTPNGTEFAIALKDAPELDASTLVVGRVLDGMDVVNQIALVNTVKDNSASPYFRAAKLIGDKRAVVAERGFNRPYSKVLVTDCGFIH